MLARLVRPFSKLSTDSTLMFETLTLVVQLGFPRPLAFSSHSTCELEIKYTVSACYESFEYVSRMRQLALDDECSRL